MKQMCNKKYPSPRLYWYERYNPLVASLYRTETTN